jgi:hypothetical protein
MSGYEGELLSSGFLISGLRAFVKRTLDTAYTAFLGRAAEYATGICYDAQSENEWASLAWESA